jgi:hypothetical protein
MSTSQQDEQAERRRVFAQDQFVQRQATTMHAHAIADAATPRGRFSAVEAQTVVGADPIPNYPPAAAAHQIQLPDEPPLAWDNPALEPSADDEAQAPGPTSADAPSTVIPSGDAQRADVGPSSKPFRRY